MREKMPQLTLPYKRGLIKRNNKSDEMTKRKIVVTLKKGIKRSVRKGGTKVDKKKAR